VQRTGISGDLVQPLGLLLPVLAFPPSTLMEGPTSVARRPKFSYRDAGTGYPWRARSAPIWLGAWVWVAAWCGGAGLLVVGVGRGGLREGRGLVG
jgi:hypothetical protein